VIVSGLPRTAILRYRRRPSSKLPWNLDLPAPADEARRVSSVRFTLRLRQRESPGHPESSLASGSLDRPDPTSPWSFGLSKVPMNRIPVRPETPVLRLRRPRFLESPRFHMVGWVDDEPWLSSNFASPVCAVDESSCPIRFRSFCLTIDALSISSVPCYRQADRRIRSQSIPHLPRGSNYCPTPYRPRSTLSVLC